MKKEFSSPRFMCAPMHISFSAKKEKKKEMCTGAFER
jgi:hypothetical protein